MCAVCLSMCLFVCVSVSVCVCLCVCVCVLSRGALALRDADCHPLTTPSSLTPPHHCDASCAGEQQVQRAFDLALAAVLGKGVYNFGELVSACSTRRVCNGTKRSGVASRMHFTFSPALISTCSTFGSPLLSSLSFVSLSFVSLSFVSLSFV